MSSAAIPLDSAWRPRPVINPWIIALTVTLATFMEVLDTSVANVALPHIAGSLSAGQDESTWVLTSYLVSNAIILPMSGWFSQLIGRKRFYMSCVALFTISSFLCGLAPNLSYADCFPRAARTRAAAACSPANRRFSPTLSSRAKRGMAFAVYGMAVVLAPAIGPTLGGWITDNFNWRWIFFINIPVGIISLLLTNMLITDPPYMKKGQSAGFRVDYIGLGLLALGLGAMQVVLDKGQRDDWFGSNFIIVMTSICVVSLIAVVIWEWRHKHPDNRFAFVQNPFLRHRQHADVHGGLRAAVQHGAAAAVFAGVMGYTAQRAGLALMPGGIAIILCMPLVGYLLGHTDARRLLLFGLAMVSFSLFHMTNFDTSIDFRTLATARVFQAMGLAFLFVPINTAAYAFSRPEKITPLRASSTLRAISAAASAFPSSPPCSRAARKCIKTISPLASILETGNSRRPLPTPRTC